MKGGQKAEAEGNSDEDGETKALSPGDDILSFSMEQGNSIPIPSFDAAFCVPGKGVQPKICGGQGFFVWGWHHQRFTLTVTYRVTLQA